MRCLVWIILSTKKGLKNSNSISFYENVLFLNELKFLDVENKC